MLKKVAKKIKSRWYDSLAPYFREGIKGRADREIFNSIDHLVDSHFTSYSASDHPCKHTLKTALQLLNKKPAVILETGSSAWGTNSSLLFDSYVNSFGGSFLSVDIRSEPMFTLGALCTKNSEFYCDDSVSFLTKYALHHPVFNLVYLDSWDVDWEKPIASAIHGMNEFLTLLPLLIKNKALLLVDDTPFNSGVMMKVAPRYIVDFEKFTQLYGFTPGKGGLIKNFLVKNGIGTEVMHDYQLLWQFN